MADDPSAAVIIDNGTGIVKSGFAGEDVPTVYFPSVIGRPKYGTMIGSDEKNIYIGNDAEKKRGVLSLTYPIAQGIVKNWDDMKQIWEYCYYNELRVPPEERPVHLTEAPSNPVGNREKMVEIFFENLQVPKFFVSVQAVLALYATGRTTGMVLDSGDGVSHCVPVFDGFSLKHAVRRMNIAGRTLTNHMSELLLESNITLVQSNELDIVKDIKEKKCYVALDFAAEMKLFENDSSKMTSYELPDGQVANFGNQQIRCPEVLFNPN